jgi:hypothetical protein
MLNQAAQKNAKQRYSVKGVKLKQPTKEISNSVLLTLTVPVPIIG